MRRTQIPLFAPETEWVAPHELKDLSGAKEVSIDLETYEKLKEEFPETIEWNISENSDMTEGSQTLACTGNNCEI